MTGAEVRAELASLEAAGERLRALPAARRIAALGRILDAWSDPGSAIRADLLDAHPAASGLGRATVAAGLELALEGWNAGALDRLVERELGAHGGLEGVSLPGVTTVIHGGVLPMPTLLDCLAPLLLGSPVLSKPASRDPVTPRILRNSLEALAPELSGCLAVARVHRTDGDGLAALLAAERVIATGSDAAVEAIRGRRAAGAPLVAHGHKLSIAVLGGEAEADLHEAAGRLAVDVALWDQLGCLSPVACWTLGAPERAQAFGEALASALAEREREWPRGEIDPASAARLAAERAEAELRAAAGRPVVLHASEGTAWTVIAEADAAPREAVLHRFVRVHPVADLDALAGALAPLAPHLTGVALEALGSGESAVCEAMGKLGASRAAPFGRLQAPPLDWQRDGLGVLTRLLR